MFKKKNLNYLKLSHFTLKLNQSVGVLICHSNNFDSNEGGQLIRVTNEHNIQFSSLKLNLIKRITNNDLIKSLVVGPTIFFFFKDFKALNHILTDKNIQNKFVPLAFYSQKRLYSYSFINNYLKSLEWKQSSQLNKDQIAVNLITNTSKTFLAPFKPSFNVFSLLLIWMKCYELKK